MFGSSLLTTSRSIVNQRFGSETQKFISLLLLDGEIKVVTTFDLNRVASLTYGNDTCFEIFELVDYIVTRPAEFTVLAVTKCLVMIKHLVMYGSEKAVNQAWLLGNKIKDLQSYNTVLMALTHPNSVSSFIQRIQGGSVDEGHPVRQAAEELHGLLSSAEKIHQVRSLCADPNSLVPIGDRSTAAFISDDVRLSMLKEEMVRQQGLVHRSNLKMAHGSFGSGYSASDGNRKIVGAAHSLEEMLVKAAREDSKYTDAAPRNTEEERHNYIQSLQIESVQNHQKTDAVADLLGITQANTYSASNVPFPEKKESLYQKSLSTFGSWDSLTCNNTDHDDLHHLGSSSLLDFSMGNCNNIQSSDILQKNSMMTQSQSNTMTKNISQSALVISSLPPPPRGAPPPPPEFSQTRFDGFAAVSQSLPTYERQEVPAGSLNVNGLIGTQNVSTLDATEIDRLSPEQRNQYLQQLLHMNQQLIKMMQNGGFADGGKK